MTIERHPVAGQVVVAIADDGVGGARSSERLRAARSRDRIEALGGRLSVESPPHRGTRLRAEIPVGAGLVDPRPGM